VLRFAATGFDLHRTCRIRKCRRDGGCTGPLLRHDAAAARFVAARPEDAIGEIGPLCCFALDEAGRGHVAAASERVLARLGAAPGVRFPEETRTIAARDWSAFSCPAESAPPEEKPL
jgi:hypothetical protein